MSAFGGKADIDQAPGFYFCGSNRASVAALAGLDASSCFLIKSVKLRCIPRMPPLCHFVHVGDQVGSALPSGRRGGDTNLHGVEKNRMRAEFAGDYDVRIGRRVACVRFRRKSLNIC